MSEQVAVSVVTSAEFINDVVRTKNMYAATWLELLFQGRKESLENQSADQSDVHEADVVRVKRIIDEIKAHEEWAQTRPNLDLAHSKNREFLIKFVGLEAKTDIQNRFWRDVARLFDYAINEAQEGESIRRRSGLDEFDVQRVDAILDEIVELLDLSEDYTPMDKPASFPSELDSSPGSQNSSPELAVTEPS